MMGGYNYRDTFLLEIGNPFYRNHFYRTWHAEEYNKIFIDYHEGLKEGRYNEEFINEMRREAFFDIYYECKFPDESQIDARGYRSLINYSTLEQAVTDSSEDQDSPCLGADIGAGGDFNVYVVRTNTNAWVEGKNQSNDTMTNVNEIKAIAERYNIPPQKIFIDDIGVGRGVSDRLKELDMPVTGVSFGQPAPDKAKYKNVKAHCFWGLKQWLESGGKLVRGGEWEQLTWIKYKVDTDKSLATEPKSDLVKRTGKSPDYADALALTFAPEQPIADVAFI
jgi:hypothetical protein